MRDSTKADIVLDYILKNTSKLSAEKIVALSSVLNAVKDIHEPVSEPNSIPTTEEHNELVEEQPIDFAEIQGIEVDGRKINTKIFKA